MLKAPHGIGSHPESRALAQHAKPSLFPVKSTRKLYIDFDLFQGTYDPCLFNSQLVERANALKAPFLQCSKFFHMISMAQLQGKEKISSCPINVQ